MFFVVCLCFPHGSEINTVVCEVVCEVERPSELSWRARHGRKKKSWMKSQLMFEVNISSSELAASAALKLDEVPTHVRSEHQLE